LDDDAYRARLL
jgi:hypothetical protein